MGLITADIELFNSNDQALALSGYLKSDEIRHMMITALVDSGASMLAINESIRNQLGLKVVEQRLAELADGQLLNYDVVGPIQMRFGNRKTVCTAMVLPDEFEPLLVKIPMYDLDLVIDESEEKVKINPNQPYISKKSLK